MPEDTTTPCHWYEDGPTESWIANCEGRDGTRWIFDDGGTPEGHHLTECPFCGDPIAVVPAPDVPMDAVELVD